jgi:putative heme-binding domain-containing protein
LAAVVAEPAVTAPLRDSICQALSGGDVTAEDAVLLQVMREAPERAQVILAETLAATKPGAEKLLALVQQGAVSPRLLQNASLKQRILSAAPMDAEARIEALTKDLPTADAAIAALIAKRREEYPKRAVSYERGQEVFKKNCASCHQIKGQGAVIGPQLDGIGNRGLERICEDVLDPNRNVDPKFFATVYAMADGQILTGLFRRQEGNTIIIADNKGKEISLDEADIDEQKTVKLSLMPDNVASSLPENEFFDLMNYLASQRQAVAEGSQGITP